MKITAKITEMSRAIQAAEGILKGIAADGVIDSIELQHLKSWLDSHKHLADLVPFSEAYDFLAQVYEQGDLTESAIEEFFDFCLHFSSANGPIDSLTADMRRLHGILQGISADGIINEKEIEYLQAWLSAHDFDKARWPIRDLSLLIQDVMADGVIDQDEEQRVLQFCRDFAYSIQDVKFTDESALPDLPYLRNDAPVVESIYGIADQDSKVSISDRSFCFTGQMKAGKRKDIQEEVRKQGGLCLSKVTRQLDYLVIGANSNPSWTYATYGRKVEQVMKNRDNNIPTLIIMEDRLIPLLRPNQ